MPNFTFLNNAITQNESKRIIVTEKNFKDFLLEKIEKINFVKVRKTRRDFWSIKGS